MRSVLPRSAFDRLRQRLRSEPPDAAPAIDILSDGRTPTSPNRWDEAYYARRNPRIQRCVEQALSGRPLHLVYQGVDAFEYDERLVMYPFFARWLRDGGRVAALVDFSGNISNKILLNALRKYVRTVCYGNLHDSTSTVVRNSVDYGEADTYQRFPARYKFPAVVGLWANPRPAYDSRLCGATIPTKCLLNLRGTPEETAGFMAQSLAPGGRLLFGASGSSVDRDALRAMGHALEGEGLAFEVQWFDARADGWQPAARKVHNFDDAYVFIMGQKGCE